MRCGPARGKHEYKHAKECENERNAIRVRERNIPHGIIVGGVGDGIGVLEGIGVLLGVGDNDGVNVIRRVRVGVMEGVKVGVTVDVGVGGNNLVGVSKTSDG